MFSKGGVFLTEMILMWKNSTDCWEAEDNNVYGSQLINNSCRTHSHINILHCVDWVDQGTPIKHIIVPTTSRLFSLTKYMPTIQFPSPWFPPKYFKVNPSFLGASSKSRENSFPLLQSQACLWVNSNNPQGATLVILKHRHKSNLTPQCLQHLHWRTGRWLFHLQNQSVH